MKILKYISILFFLPGISISTGAQEIHRFNTFSYSVNEGLLQSTITDMEFDKLNFCWISFPNGIQKFDGENFISIPVQPGLPGDQFCNLFKSSSGDLLISHSQGISIYSTATDKFNQVYTYADGQNSPVQFIGEDDGIIYFFNSTFHIIGIRKKDFSIISNKATGFQQFANTKYYVLRLSDNIYHHTIAMNINESIYLWDLKKGKLLSHSAPWPGISPYFLHIKNDSEVLIQSFQSGNALQLYNFKTKSVTSLRIENKDNTIAARCVLYNWGDKPLISFSDKLYETDSGLKILKAEIVNFQNKSVAENNTINAIKQDNFGNLYLQTVSGGIKKIIRKSYPLKYYYSDTKKSNYIYSVLPDKPNNRVFAGSNGLFVFDTLQHLIKYFDKLPGAAYNIINSIIKCKQGYLLFVNGERKLWLLNNELTHFTVLPFTESLEETESGIGYFCNTIYANVTEAVVISENHLYRINFSKNTVTESYITNGYIMSGILYNNYIILHTNDMLIFLNAQSFKEVKRIPFKNTGNVRCYARSADGNLFIGSNKGIFKIDSSGKVLQHYTKQNGLPDECIYAMLVDKKGSLWCSTNKGILKIDNSGIFQLQKEDGLQENEFNTNVAAVAEDGEFFFGGVNGLSSFFPSAIKDFTDDPRLIFTGIKINNNDYTSEKSIYTLQKISLPYNQNNISFDFIAMGDKNPNQYIYQYKLKGLDKEWIQAAGIKTARYNLQPGSYTFQLYASNQFNKNAHPLKEFFIVIQPPFWKTWWFITACAILAVALLFVFINQQNKRMYEKKLQHFQTQQQLKIERERISKDLHDNIGAYASAIIADVEYISDNKTDQKEERLKNLQSNSKEIIHSLRDTIWVLNKENIAITGISDRIKNYINKLKPSYQQINISIDEDIENDMQVGSQKALNIFRIIQEAIHNALKHSDANNISILIKSDEHIFIEIKDDGIGFGNVNGDGNGLRNMRARAADAGIEISVKSEVNNGTCIFLKMVTV